MAKVARKYINQIRKCWDDLYSEAWDAMEYVVYDTDCDERHMNTLEKLYDRFDKAMAHLEEDKNGE